MNEGFGEDVDPVVIDLFNRKFKTNYLAPLTYDFRKDYKIAEKINTLKPLINFNSDRAYKHKSIVYRIRR